MYRSPLALTFQQGEVSPHYFTHTFITTKIFNRWSHFSTIASLVGLGELWSSNKGEPRRSEDSRSSEKEEALNQSPNDLISLRRKSKGDRSSLVVLAKTYLLPSSWQFLLLCLLSSWNFTFHNTKNNLVTTSTTNTGWARQRIAFNVLLSSVNATFRKIVINFFVHSFGLYFYHLRSSQALPLLISKMIYIFNWIFEV